MYLNKAIIAGNLTRDPELKSLPSGVQVCNMSVATNSSYTTKSGEKVDKVEFHSVIIFGKTAENCAKYLKKGQSVLVEGSLQTRSWDKPDGSKAYKTEILAQGVQFGSRQNAPDNAGEAETEKTIDITPEDETPQKTPKTSKKPALGESIEYPKESIDPADIPF